ncbi:MAG: glycosyltransferase family 2 protein [Vicinamibacterales bacterium]
MASTGSSSSAPSVEDAAPADLIVGVPTYNHAGTIGAIVRSARAAITGEFHDLRGRIIIADGSSTDGTPAQAAAALGEGRDSLTVLTIPNRGNEGIELPYHGTVSGRGRALHVLLEAARDSDARAVAALDGNAAGTTPAWVAALARPVLDGSFDFVAPRYRRHPFDGALIRSIVQPVFRACYGLQLEQPMATDFGCSRRLLEHVLNPGIWPGDGDHTLIDLWLAATAASGGFQVCEAAVGTRRRGAREEAQDLSGTIARIVGALFTELERRAAVWHRVRGSTAVPLFGSLPDDTLEAPAVNPSLLLQSFRLGYRELADVWAEILPPATILELRRLAAAPEETFRIDDHLWARMIYDFALGHRLRVIPRDHLLRSLTPLYLGWLASFILGARNEPENEVDARLERTCQAFESEKPYLISRWRWPERFRPMRLNG